MSNVVNTTLMKDSMDSTRNVLKALLAVMETIKVVKDYIEMSVERRDLFQNSERQAFDIEKKLLSKDGIEEITPEELAEINKFVKDTKKIFDVIDGVKSEHREAILSRLDDIEVYADNIKQAKTFLDDISDTLNNENIDYDRREEIQSTKDVYITALINAQYGINSTETPVVEEAEGHHPVEFSVSQLTFMMIDKEESANIAMAIDRLAQNLGRDVVGFVGKEHGYIHAGTEEDLEWAKNVAKVMSLSNINFYHRDDFLAMAQAAGKDVTVFDGLRAEEADAIKEEAKRNHLLISVSSEKKYDDKGKEYETYSVACLSDDVERGVGDAVKNAVIRMNGYGELSGRAKISRLKHNEVEVAYRFASSEACLVGKSGKEPGKAYVVDSRQTDPPHYAVISKDGFQEYNNGKLIFDLRKDQCQGKYDELLLSAINNVSPAPVVLKGDEAVKYGVTDGRFELSNEETKKAFNGIVKSRYSTYLENYSKENRAKGYAESKFVKWVARTYGNGSLKQASVMISSDLKGCLEEYRKDQEQRIEKRKDKMSENDIDGSKTEHAVRKAERDLEQLSADISSLSEKNENGEYIIIGHAAQFAERIEQEEITAQELSLRDFSCGEPEIDKNFEKTSKVFMKVRDEAIKSATTGQKSHTVIRDQSYYDKKTQQLFYQKKEQDARRFAERKDKGLPAMRKTDQDISEEVREELIMEDVSNMLFNGAEPVLPESEFVFNYINEAYREDDEEGRSLTELSQDDLQSIIPADISMHIMDGIGEYDESHEEQQQTR